jgi:hypothetical protein
MCLSIEHASSVGDSGLAIHLFAISESSLALLRPWPWLAHYFGARRQPESVDQPDGFIGKYVTNDIDPEDYIETAFHMNDRLTHDLVNLAAATAFSVCWRQ